MFPGYDKGETTQRIAAGIFEKIKDYKVALAVVPVKELSFGVFLKNMLKISLTVCR